MKARKIAFSIFQVVFLVLILAIAISASFKTSSDVEQDIDENELSSDNIFENPKLNSLSDFIFAFGMLVTAILVAVLLKSFFDYVKAKNNNEELNSLDKRI
ncbi:MAG: hypothetical protein ACW99Q_00730 [Candidatus Kariarchaeaceae archaeon]|jgi:preprotein translocase subunit SecG